MAVHEHKGFKITTDSGEVRDPSSHKPNGWQPKAKITGSNGVLFVNPSVKAVPTKDQADAIALEHARKQIDEGKLGLTA